MAAAASVISRAWDQLTHLALRLVRPGGILVQASCSSRVTPEQFFHTVTDAAVAAGIPLERPASLRVHADHVTGLVQQ